jgi:hypothetical protein
VVGQGQRPNAYGEFGSLAKHLRYVERHARKLARSTFYAMNRYQAGLEQKQAVLGRVVDIGAELFAISSAVVYANTIRSEHPERGEQAYELADLFAQHARRRADELFHGLWSNDDSENYTLAQQVLKGRYEWLEEGFAGPSDDDKPQVAKQPEADGQNGSRATDREAMAGDADGNGAPRTAAQTR